MKKIRWIDLIDMGTIDTIRSIDGLYKYIDKYGTTFVCSVFIDGSGKIINLPTGIKFNYMVSFKNLSHVDLPKNMTVGGSLSLSGSNVGEIPSCIKINGHLHLNSAKIDKFPKINKLNVGHSIYIKDTYITPGVYGAMIIPDGYSGTHTYIYGMIDSKGKLGYYFGGVQYHENVRFFNYLKNHRLERAYEDIKNRFYRYFIETCNNNINNNF